MTMDKERLEEIKLLWEQDNDVCFPDDYEWLIEQAELVKRLIAQVNEFVDEDINIEDSLFTFVEAHFKDLREKWGNKPYSDKDHKNSVMLREILKEIERIMEQNKRYREALEFYAIYAKYVDEVYVKAGMYTKLADDCGKIARKALKEEE